MSLGNPSLDPAAGSPWQRGERFATMIASPLAHGYGRTETTPPMNTARGSTFPTLGHRITGMGFGTLGANAAPPTGGGILPSAGALDYAHKFTSTTLLLGGLIAFLIFHRGNYRRAARNVATRHIGEV